MTDILSMPEGSAVCPFMSGNVAPVQANGNIQQIGGVSFSPIMMQCVREKCQLWLEGEKRCGMMFDPVIITGITAAIYQHMQQFEPLLSGSPATRIAEALEKLIETRKS